MNGSPVAGLVRGWVDLYTRGLPADARTARRDEIDDDLWCEHAEAAAAGRSARSLDADLFLRLLFGIPADVSWRLANRGHAAPSSLDGRSSMSTRTLGMVAIVAGSFPGLLIILYQPMGDTLWASAGGVVLLLGSFVAFPAAALGLAWRFQDRLGPVGAVGAILVTVGMAMIIGAVDVGPVPRAGFVVVPVGSVMLMWDLARAGIARRAATAQLLILVVVIGLALLGPGQTSGLATAIVVALFAYLLTWIAIGVSLIRGVPQAQARSG
jgi:hypothetical protein